MRYTASLLVTFFALSNLEAAVVTFDDMAPIAYCSEEPCVVSTSTPQGFIFAADSTYPDMTLVYTGVGPTGNYLAAVEAPAGPGNMVLRVSHESGQAFDFASADFYLRNVEVTGQFPFASVTPIEIKGYDEFDNVLAVLSIAPAGDASASQWVTQAFNGNWNAVHSVTISQQIMSSQFGSDVHDVLLDNFSATVVPIPAAVWLFGSALAGLGWLRRKQTA